VQVHPIKPTLTAPGIKRLKLRYDEPLSKIAFKFNLRRYSEAADDSKRRFGERQGLTLVHFSAQRKRFVWDRRGI